MDRGREREFRRLVLQLADTETNKLVYIYDLPREYKDKQPHVVLELIHNWHLFSASKPENLAKLMEGDQTRRPFQSRREIQKYAEGRVEIRGRDFTRA